jgi:VIT1/CCC1 family predicted Fe2+/Mn2+ transporter
MVPILAYFVLPKPLDIVVSLGVVGIVVGVFLVRYRSRRSKVHWKVTLLETVVIIAIAVIVSLIIGGSA